MSSLEKELKTYYINQAGTGLAGFQGVRYQRGHGFFGRMLSKAVFPLLRFLGTKAAGVGANIANDVFIDKKDWKESTKHRLEDEGKELAKLGIDRAKRFVQEGKGRKRTKSKEKLTKRPKKRRKIRKYKKTLALEKLLNP